MSFEHLFSGSAVGRVAADGTVSLPPFIARVLAGASVRQLIVSAHDTDPCLKAYEASHQSRLLAEVERRRLRDEAEGRSGADHHQRARRAFGFAEEAPVDADGRLALPPMMLRKGGIRGTALFVGTGESFEIWDPETARTAGDESLREIVMFRVGSIEEEEDRG
jgi:MraZ protein